jgi:hypothetical protein
MRRTGIGLLALLCAVGIGYGCFMLYQHHLSSDVKPLLIAACAENIQITEARSYLHDARPLLKTEKDHAMFEKLERAMTMLTDYQEHEDTALDRLKANLEEMRPDNESSECGGKFWRLVHAKPPGAPAQAEQAYKEMQECEKRRQETEERNNKLADSELQEGKRLYNDVRTTLGLPPLNTH